MDYDDHGVITTTTSARRFKFEDGNKCTLTVEDTTEFENGSYNKSVKGYTFVIDDSYIEGDFICYKIIDDMMQYEDEELTYTITGKNLTLGRMSTVFKKQ